MWILTQQVNYRSYVLHSSNTWEKWEYNEAVHQLFIEFKKAYDSIRRETLYNIFNEFGIPMKQVRLINIDWNIEQSQGRQEFVWYASY
jgi:hypothetical protein